MTAIRSASFTALSAILLFGSACGGDDASGPPGQTGGAEHDGGSGGDSSIGGAGAGGTAGSGPRAGSDGGGAHEDAAVGGSDASPVDAMAEVSDGMVEADGSRDVSTDTADAVPDVATEAAPDVSTDGANAAQDASSDSPGATVLCEGGVCASCSAILSANPAATDGIYAVDPDGAGGIAPIDVYCDMSGSLSGGTSGGWMLLGRDPGASYDVPTSSTTLNAWNGDLGNRAGYLSVTEDTLDLLTPSHLGRFRMDGGSWYETTGQKFTASGCGTTTNGCMQYWSGELAVVFDPLYSDANNPDRQDLLVYQSASNSSVGCPELWNTQIQDGAAQPIADTGTAGAGDYNARSGAGCWGISSLGPVSAEIWVK